MARLTIELGINDTLLKKLQTNKVLTVIDFIQEDSEKLSSMCNATFKEILDVRHKLIKNFSALPVSGSSAYEQLLASSALIASGIDKLDNLLGGGFMTGAVYELCGLSGEGKTQLCLSVSAHVSAVLKQSVHYVDTKGDFSSQRALSMMKHKNITDKECREALSRIAVTKVNDIYELIRFLHHLKKTFIEDNDSPPRVVIIDSMPALYFPFMGSTSTQGFGLLNHVMATMKSMATEYHILFIEVNIASTFVETEAIEGEKEDEGDVRPMLGKYWLHAPNTRLLISKLNNEAPQRMIRVKKSTNLSLGISCIVTILPQGVI